MPKISAPTVREHHANVLATLVDTAEDILRSGEELTAGAVACQAGIARNSVYRYVGSIDDLRGHVVVKHLPAWTSAVHDALTGVTDPAERIVVWAQANLQQAAQSGHGWLMRLAREVPLPPDTAETVIAAHVRANAHLRAAWEDYAPAQADVGVAFVMGILEAGFRRLDDGDDPGPTIATLTHALRVGVAALGATPR